MICFDPLPEDVKLKLKSKGLRLYFLSDLIEEGRKKIAAKKPVQPSSVFTFSYTSGTTGKKELADDCG